MFGHKRAARLEQLRQVGAAVSTTKNAQRLNWNINRNSGDGEETRSVNRQTAGVEAVQFAREIISSFHWPTTPRLQYSGMRRTSAGVDDKHVDVGVITVTGNVRTASGVTLGFDIPVEIRNGKLLEPVVMIHNGSPYVISQSAIDSMVRNATTYGSVPTRTQFSAPLTEAERASRQSPRVERRAPGLFRNAEAHDALRRFVRSGGHRGLEKLSQMVEEAGPKGPQPRNFKELLQGLGYGTEEQDQNWKGYERVQPRERYENIAPDPTQPYSGLQNDYFPEQPMELTDEVADQNSSGLELDTGVQDAGFCPGCHRPNQGSRFAPYCGEKCFVNYYTRNTKRGQAEIEGAAANIAAQMAADMGAEKALGLANMMATSGPESAELFAQVVDELAKLVHNEQQNKVALYEVAAQLWDGIEPKGDTLATARELVAKLGLEEAARFANAKVEASQDMDFADFWISVSDSVNDMVQGKQAQMEVGGGKYSFDFEYFDDRANAVSHATIRANSIEDAWFEFTGGESQEYNETPMHDGRFHMQGIDNPDYEAVVSRGVADDGSEHELFDGVIPDNVQGPSWNKQSQMESEDTDVHLYSNPERQEDDTTTDDDRDQQYREDNGKWMPGMKVRVKKKLAAPDRGGGRTLISGGTTGTVIRDQAGDGVNIYVELSDKRKALIPAKYLSKSNSKSAQAKPLDESVGQPPMESITDRGSLPSDRND